MDLSQVLIVPSFKNINFSVFLSRPILLIVLVLFFLVYSVLSSVIIYHWNAYGMKSYGILAMESLFLFVSLVLFVIAGTAMTYF